MNVESVNAILVTLENTVKMRKTKPFAKSLNHVSCLNFSLKIIHRMIWISIHRIVVIILILVIPKSHFLAKDFPKHVLEITTKLQVCIHQTHMKFFFLLETCKNLLIPWFRNFLTHFLFHLFITLIYFSKFQVEPKKATLLIL